MPRPIRTQRCSGADARTRQAQARKFLEVAELVATEQAIPASASAAGALAVLAGIAASDAACCHSLGRRSRSEDHRDAAALLSEVNPGGAGAATTLRRLLDVKDKAHYGLIHLTGQELRVALRQARRLVEFADDALRR
jgi:hypothetical protein